MKTRRQRYLTSVELAAICDVNRKTIAVWIQKKGIPHFRTPGGQARFKLREVVEWLRKHHFDVPKAIAEAAQAAEEEMEVSNSCGGAR